MAGRPRLPEAVARVTGAAAKNPQRHRNRARPKVAGLGDPPDYLTEAEAEAWAWFGDEMPWLGAPDRTIVEVAARLRADLATGEASLKAMTELRQVLNALGATPAARSKVMAPSDDEDEDPADQFFN